MNERQAILAAYTARGEKAVSGKGGFWLNGRGFVSLATARKETGVSQPKKRQPREIVSACGDLAWIAALNGGL